MNGFRRGGLGRRVAAAVGLIVVIAVLAGLLLVLAQLGLGRGVTPTPEPTASPIAEVSIAPTASPTPTPFPTDSPTPLPSPTASPTPTAKPAAVHPNLADLAPAGAGIGTNNTIKCGVPVTVWVNIKNKGYVTAPAGVMVYFKITLGFWSQYTPVTTAPIAPGRTLKLTMQYQARSPCAAEKGTVFFRIDYSRIVPEISENNNEASFNFTAS